MRILIAEDEATSQRVLESTLVRWGHEIIVTRDGNEALAELEKADAPALAILDVMMPRLDGIEVCRRVRSNPHLVEQYLILLTARTAKEDIVRGLEAGANDYVTKPFDQAELLARINVGSQMLALQGKLVAHVEELEGALSQVKVLQGMLPICSYCKSIRDDQDYWQAVESYIIKHSSVQFSHGICPNCYEKIVLPDIEQMRERMKAQEQK